MCSYKDICMHTCVVPEEASSTGVILPYSIGTIHPGYFCLAVLFFQGFLFVCIVLVCVCVCG